MSAIGLESIITPSLQPPSAATTPSKDEKEVESLVSRIYLLKCKLRGNRTAETFLHDLAVSLLLSSNLNLKNVQVEQDQQAFYEQKFVQYVVKSIPPFFPVNFLDDLEISEVQNQLVWRVKPERTFVLTNGEIYKAGQILPSRYSYHSTLFEKFIKLLKARGLFSQFKKAVTKNLSHYLKNAKGSKHALRSVKRIKKFAAATMQQTILGTASVLAAKKAVAYSKRVLNQVPTLHRIKQTLSFDVLFDCMEVIQEYYRYGVKEAFSEAGRKGIVRSTTSLMESAVHRATFLPKAIQLPMKLAVKYGVGSKLSELFAFRILGRPRSHELDITAVLCSIGNPLLRNETTTLVKEVFDRVQNSRAASSALIIRSKL